MPSSFNKRIVITGTGLVTPYGIGVKHNWDLLLSGKTSIKNNLLKTIKSDIALSDNSYICGKVPIGLSPSFNFAEHFNNSIQSTTINSTQYALVAASEAIKEGDWDKLTIEQKEETGVSIGTGIGSLESIVNGVSKKISPYYMIRILPSMSASNISRMYSFYGPVLSPSLACSTGLQSIIDSFLSIQSNSADRMVAGATEGSANEYTIKAFSRAKALYTGSDINGSRPFDSMRSGFIVSEGSGVMLLENYDYIQTTKKGVIGAEIIGFGQAFDSASLVSPDPNGNGIEKAMKKCLKMANVSPKDVSAIFAHATSTVKGDEAEAIAINKIFGHNIKVTATKGSLGHTLGASGAIDTIFAINSLKTGILPHVINCHNPITNLNILNTPQKYCNNLDLIMVNNAAFGGINISLLLKKITL